MIEQQLRETLARKSPPPGFSARVMAAVEHETRAPRRQTSRVWQWAAAAALLMAIGGGTTAHYIEVRRGERAKEQVLLALRITSAKLRDTRQHVRAIGRQEE